VLKQSGPDGACGPVKDKTDPHDTCPVDPPASCGRDGTCDGNGACRLHYAAGTPCAMNVCAGNASTTGVCDGNGVCQSKAIDCGAFACVGGVCTTSCMGPADCAPGAQCNAGACEAKGANGSSCTSNDACTSGFCVDGKCCNSACGGQCEACDVNPGTCTTVTGAPHGARPACAADDPGNVCAAKECNGTEPTTCSFVGAKVSCGQSACTDGASTSVGTCDAKGNCDMPDGGSECAPISTPPANGGCGCRASREVPSSFSFALVGVVVAFGLRRRKR
jgi:MYXO-CTERM domain-containing protein